MEINTNIIRAFRADFDTAVTELENKYGFKLQLGSVKYSADEFHTTLTVKKTDESGSAIDNSWKDGAFLLGLAPEWSGKTFVPTGGKEALQIVGLNLRRPKNPCELVGVTSGKRFKSSADFVKRNMK